MERIWLTRLLHRAFRLATAACSSLSRTVTVRVLTVLVLRLTDSSLPWAEAVVVEPVVVEAVAGLVHHHVGEDLPHAA